MSKIPAKRIASDDCMVHVGRVIQDGKITSPGTPYKVHTGEWVEIRPVQTIAELGQLTRLQAGLMGAKTDIEAVEAFEAICGALANHLVSWNWTDNDNAPLPLPHKNPEAIKRISSDELAWLIRVICQGETPEERKNG